MTSTGRGARPPARSRRTRRKAAAAKRRGGLLGGLIALPILLALGYGGLWLWAAQRMEEAVEAAGGKLADAGFAVTIANQGVRGFPASVVLDLSGLRVEARKGVPLLFQADGVSLTWSPLAPGRLALAARAGQARLGLVKARADRLDLTVLEDAAGTSISGDAKGLVLLAARNGRGGIRPERARLDLFLPKTPQDGEAAGETALRLPPRLEFRIFFGDVGIGAPAAEAARRGDSLALIAAQASWRGPWPRPVDAAQLAAWRDAGGTLELEALSIQLGEAKLDAEGTLALDERLRPLAALDLTLTRPAALINFSVAHGLLTLEEARILSARIRTLTDDKPNKAARLPLMVEDGRVMLDTLMIGRVDPLA